MYGELRRRGGKEWRKEAVEGMRWKESGGIYGEMQ